MTSEIKATVQALVDALEDLVALDFYEIDYDGHEVQTCPACGKQDGEHNKYCAFVAAQAAILAGQQLLAQEPDDSDINQVHDANATVTYPTMYFGAPPPVQEPAPQVQPLTDWISVKDALPPKKHGTSYMQHSTGVVLVKHSDRPDYPITAHAIVGEGLGVGIAIPTEGAAEYPEIAWYSVGRDLQNPFDLKNQDFDKYLPKIFGSKITHWMPISEGHGIGEKQ